MDGSLTLSSWSVPGFGAPTSCTHEWTCVGAANSWLSQTDRCSSVPVGIDEVVNTIIIIYCQGAGSTNYYWCITQPPLKLLDLPASIARPAASLHLCQFMGVALPVDQCWPRCVTSRVYALSCTKCTMDAAYRPRSIGLRPRSMGMA